VVYVRISVGVSVKVGILDVVVESNYAEALYKKHRR
jgi:hypothetical protein